MLALKAVEFMPAVTAWLWVILSPPSARGVLLPLMPLVISRDGSTTSMAKMPLMTRFMVRSAKWKRHSLNQEELEQPWRQTHNNPWQWHAKCFSNATVEITQFTYSWSLNCTSPAGSSQGVPAVPRRT